MYTIRVVKAVRLDPVPPNVEPIFVPVGAFAQCVDPDPDVCKKLAELATAARGLTLAKVQSWTRKFRALDYEALAYAT